MEGIKQRLFEECKAYVNQRVSNAKAAMQDAQNSANAETKSTAGDKHDTARAMMQLVAEQNAKHLAEAQKLNQVLALINPEENHTKVQLGSLVKASTGNFFISISVGKMEIDKDLYFGISPTSPIGQLLMDKTQGEQVIFNGRNISILEIH